MMRFSRGGVCVLSMSLALAVMTGAVPAAADPDPALSAEFNGAPPAGWPGTYTYLHSFGVAGGPQGTLIADSGFRPWPNGFPMPNWGDADSLATHRLIFGGGQRVTPETLTEVGAFGQLPLNSLAMRRSFGDGVCRDGKAGIDKKTGQCDMTYGAELLARAITNGSDGGHCYGFSAAAVGLYNGTIPANQVGASGAGINAMNPMGAAAVQTITRFAGTQGLIPELLETWATSMSPTDVVNALIRDFRAGYEPYVLGVFGGPGGHAVVPYAVFDRGDGLYDIAIYDNNFPNRPSAMTVNTVDDSFVFSSALNPEDADYRWDSTTGSRMNLIDVVNSDALDEADCPVCKDVDGGTYIAFSAVDEANSTANGGIRFDAARTDGKKWALGEISVMEPALPTGGKANLESIWVAPGIDFQLSVIGGNVKGKQPLEVYMFRGGDSTLTVIDEVKSESSTGIQWNGPSLAASSDKSNHPRLVMIQDEKRKTVMANGHMLNGPANVTAQEIWDPKSETMTFLSNATVPVKWNAQVIVDSELGEENWVAKSVLVPVGGRLVVGYPVGSAAPEAGLLDRRGDLIRMVEMVPVTAKMVKKDAGKLYVPQGGATG